MDDQSQPVSGLLPGPRALPPEASGPSATSAPSETSAVPAAGGSGSGSASGTASPGRRPVHLDLDPGRRPSRRRRRAALRFAGPSRGHRSSATHGWRGWRDRRRWPWLAAALVAVVLAVGGGVLLASGDDVQARTVSTTQLVAAIGSGHARELTLDDGARTATLQLDGSGSGATLRATYPAAYGDDLLNAAVAHDVPVQSVPVGSGKAVPALLLGLLVVGLLGLLLTRHGRGLPTGRLGGRRHDPIEDVPATRFADVAGAGEAVTDLAELVDFLRDPERWTRTGARPPKGALLVGPPGTGKTLLARAVAGEAGVAFFSAAGSDFVEMFVGNGARRVRDLFDKARKAERAIVFIDEIDAVARTRSAGPTAADSERDGTLVALLHEMDGFTGSGIVVLAATNRPDVLDPAITRPGRLDRRIEVPLPDRRGREQILGVHVTGRPVAPEVDLTALARRTPGFSGAQLAAVVNEACLQAARLDQRIVDQVCFDAAVATVAMGRARTSALVTDHDRRVTAWHESGHAVAAYLLPDADDPVQVTIVPRGPAGGVTWMSGNDDVFLPRRKAHAQLVVALAGRAAEMRLLHGEFTQGAHGDLTNATDLAVRMVTQYGMTDYGLAVRDERLLAAGGSLAESVMAVVDAMLADALDGATALLEEHAALLDAVAERLLDEETLTLADIALTARALEQATGRR